MTETSEAQPRVGDAHRAAVLQAVNAAAQAIYESVPGVMASDWYECIGSAEKVVVAVHAIIAKAAREQERERARGDLLAIRRIGARSGTNINAWNEAFDLIDAALARVESS